jgi:hypothetical protein
VADFDALISMEEQLDASLGRYASIDGHDFGSGEMNLFIETDRPAEAFADAADVLRGGPRWGDLRAAYREHWAARTRFSGRRASASSRSSEGLPQNRTDRP